MTGPAVKDVKDTVTQMGLGLGFEPLDLPLVILVVLIINCSYLSLLRDLVLLIRAIELFQLLASTFRVKAWHNIT